MWCLICLVSPVLVKVYDVFPWLMYGQVRQPCLELQRNVQAGGLPGVLSLFASFARTSRSRRFGERQKGTTGTSLKIFLKRWIAKWVVVGKTSYTWPGGRLILLAEILTYNKSATDTWAFNIANNWPWQNQCCCIPRLKKGFRHGGPRDPFIETKPLRY